jgi:hypothetical protein
MTEKPGSKAIKRNPALGPFEVLVGEWQTTGSHPYFPDAELHGRVVFEWIEGGAFLLMRSEIDHPKFPDGVAIFGSDDDHFSQRFTMTIEKDRLTTSGEMSRDGGKWEKDLSLVYEKV